jgi:DeoR/GlpR family transcriptional regulator of sugar metabolism
MSSAAQQRRSMILDELAHRRTVHISDLSVQFGVSDVLIRRDLERLHEQGLLKRIHGGAVALPSNASSAALETQPTGHLAEKERIGRAAAELICPGDSLIFDSGTTPLQVARHIPGDLLIEGHLTVITLSLPIIQELGSWKDVHLILLGGIYLPDYQVAVGPLTINNVNALHADKMFMGTDGITTAHGLTTANVLEAEVDRALVKAASQIIVVADSSKFGRIGLSTIAAQHEIHVLVTDKGAPPDAIAELRDLGVNVILA